MFLHKFDILNRNLNGLLQKCLPFVTKLCAVTKLGDLTVRRYPNVYQNNLFPSDSYGNRLKLMYIKIPMDL
jgi:hypothetical protein